MPVLSMTGYGSARAELGGASITLEVRSFNHRFLDVRVRLPGPLQEHAFTCDEIARKLLVRGRVEIGGRLDGRLGAGVSLDRARAKAVLQELDALSAELGGGREVPLSLLAMVPGLLVEDGGSDAELVRNLVADATERACQALCEMRRSEGEALRRDLSTRLERIGQLTREAHARSPEWTRGYRDRMQTRLSALLSDRNVALDPGRLEHELAMLAERCDVSEELTRLGSHCDQFAASLQQSGEPCGRRLEFLLQEMAREANTMGAKSADLRMTASTLDIKTELERMREQVQNVL